jgi:hypothetical protein
LTVVSVLRAKGSLKPALSTPLQKTIWVQPMPMDLSANDPEPHAVQGVIVSACGTGIANGRSSPVTLLLMFTCLVP